MFRKKDSFQFKGRKHSRGGNFSVFTGCIVLILFLAAAGISAGQKGNGALWLGAVGILCFFLSVAGFILGYTGFKEKDIYYTAPVAGVVLNGFWMIVYLSLYVIGVLS